MKIIPHRGFWTSRIDQNSKTAILDAIELFDGVEIDLRDYGNELVISHDPFSGGVKFEDILVLSSKVKSRKIFAINVKSDGISYELKRILKRHQIMNYFIFDLSFPELLTYRKLRINVFERLSEFEKPYLVSPGVVIDAFYKDVDLSCLSNFKNYFFISPEIHGRDPYGYWKKLSGYFSKNSSNLTICTDLPLELHDFWYSHG